ncbi:MAG: amidohydrolase family protein [Planctomycetota bacterium]|nr:amidohydrolase family protein [Planctomycetota bacterium]
MSSIIDAYTTSGTERETALPVEELIRQLDDAGIARAVVAPEDREIAVHNRAGNERIARLAADAPGSPGGTGAPGNAGRLIPACTVNPWFGAEGVKELSRAVHAGARMLVLAPALQGFYLGDEIANPLYEAAKEMLLPVYVHTGPHGPAAPTQLALVAMQFPRTRFIMGHCGSTDHAHDMPAALKLKLPNLWFELSLVRPFAIHHWGKIAGDERLIFGTSAPRNLPRHELQHADLSWPIAKNSGTYGRNIEALLAEVRP